MMGPGEREGRALAASGTGEIPRRDDAFAEGLEFGPLAGEGDRLLELVERDRAGVRLRLDGAGEVEDAGRILLAEAFGDGAERRFPSGRAFDLLEAAALERVAGAAGIPIQHAVFGSFGSDGAALIKADLRKRNMAYEGPDLDQGDAWGYRHQFNIADSGYGGRAPRVWGGVLRRLRESLRKAAPLGTHVLG